MVQELRRSVFYLGEIKRQNMNMNKTTFGAILLSGVLALTACKSSQNLKKENKNEEMEIVKNGNDWVDPVYLTLSDAQRHMVARNNVFALQLFNATRGQQSDVVSPLSVSYLMGMLANGAQDKTLQEIMKTMGCEGVDLQEVNELYQSILQTAGQRDPQTVVNIANYVAVNRNYQVHDAFAQAVKQHYQAQVECLNFADSKTTKHINDWCRRQTHDMIPSIIDQVNAGAVSYLMNAIYFNGTWDEKFDARQTKHENFRGLTRDIQKVDMMHQCHKFLYAENKAFQAVNLPYGNGTYSMTVLLPREGKSIDEMMATIDASSWAKLNVDMDYCMVDLKLPKFTTESKYSLNNVISQLGAPSMFKLGEANFSRFADGDFYVSQMLQKAKIEVSEEGTKAAAVTAAVMLTSAAPMPLRHVSFVANHPFVYVISDNQSGALLFIGQYMGIH